MLNEFRKAKNTQEIIGILKKEHGEITFLDMFREQTLERMIEPTEITLKVFVAACQNLSAADENKHTDYKNILAGDKALSSSDPFLKMRIVDKEKRHNYNGVQDKKLETLDPQFYC